MTIGIFTLLSLIGSLVLLKLGLIVLAVVLLAKTLFSGIKLFAPSPAIKSMPVLNNARH